MKIALVLRSGGDYNASDVQWLVNQLPKDYEIICLTDLKCLHVPGVKVIPLINQWQKCRGWWAKIELFRPDITDDLFYLDLDTVIGVVCGRGRNPTLRLWPTIFSGKIDVFPGDRRSRLISSMTSVAPA